MREGSSWISGQKSAKQRENVGELVRGEVEVSVETEGGGCPVNVTIIAIIVVTIL